ncbi:MAG: sugar phosphate nucleotidyltransferase [Clostridiales bacterium]|nr:sugar phosphate nucleotidyltransferase [Clostridiales bacterium]
MDTTLLIMAAGIGSRFGTGIKQLAEVDGCGHIIMDYSVHDAVEAGFNNIVFIIRKDIEDEFKEVIGNRIEKMCAKHSVGVFYAFQSIDNIPGELPEGRTKPWGTGQAVLAAKEFINTPFAVINADDYYGREAYRTMHDWLVESHEPNAYAMAGFILKNTLSDNGGVTRGVCTVEDGHTHVVDVVETRNIIKTAEGAEADGVKLDTESFVSMNFWGFPGNPPKFLEVLEDGFAEFFKTQVPDCPLKSEYLLPTVIGGMLRAGKCTVKVLPTNDTWYGMTYKEDVAAVKEAFAKLIAGGVYSEGLFDDL